MIIPFAFFIQSLDMISFSILDKHLAISFFLGIAIGPMFSDILIRDFIKCKKRAIERIEPKKYQLAPETKMWQGFFPNPLKILTGNKNFSRQLLLLFHHLLLFLVL